MGNVCNKRKVKSCTSIQNTRSESGHSNVLSAGIIPPLHEKPANYIQSLTSVKSDETFNWSRIQSIYFNCKSFEVHDDSLTPTAARNVKQILRAVERNCESAALDSYKRSDRISSVVLQTFSQAHRRHNLAEPELAMKQMLIVHSGLVLHMHKMILEYLEHNNKDVFELLKQIAVSHALMGITAADFRSMDLYIIKYLGRQSYIHDNNIKDSVGYLGHITQIIANTLEHRSSVRCNMIRTLTRTESEDDRNSQARENYRIIKGWNKTLDQLGEYKTDLKKRLQASLDEVEIEDDVLFDASLFKENHHSGTA